MIETDVDPGGVAVDEEALWVANNGSNTVSRLDGFRHPRALRVGEQPFGVATGAGAVWVTNRLDGTVSRIPSGTREADGDPITVGANPKGIAVGDDAVWVANTDDGTVSRIDPEAVEADAETITVGTEPRGVVAAFGSVWVTNGSRQLGLSNRPRGPGGNRDDPRRGGSRGDHRGGRQHLGRKRRRRHGHPDQPLSDGAQAGARFRSDRPSPVLLWSWP